MGSVILLCGRQVGVERLEHDGREHSDAGMRRSAMYQHSIGDRAAGHGRFKIDDLDGRGATAVARG